MLCYNMVTEGKDLMFSKMTLDGMLPYFLKYKVIHNFLTHFMKSVHLNGGEIVTCDTMSHKCSMCPPLVTWQTSSQ